MNAHEPASGEDTELLERALEDACASLGFTEDQCSFLHKELSAAVTWVRARGVGMHPATTDPAGEVAAAAIARVRSGAVHAEAVCTVPRIVADPSMLKALRLAYDQVLTVLGPETSRGGRERLALALLVCIPSGDDMVPIDGEASSLRAIETLSARCEECLRYDAPFARLCPWRD